jgi:hypothetical protein
MSLDDLLTQYRKDDVDVLTEPSIEKATRPEKVFNLSVDKNITTDEADSEVLTQEILDWTALRESDPVYQDMDGLIDVFDPSEPPTVEGDVANPELELLRAEANMIKGPAKFAMKAMSYLYAPLNRSFKFVTNAMMYDPLTKSAVGPVKKAALVTAQEMEIRRRFNEHLKKNNLTVDEIALMSPGEREGVLSVRDSIRDDVARDSASIIKRLNTETEEAEPVTAGDFAESGVNALKALVPWPGFADEVKSFGTVGADSYERIVGRQAPWYYAPVGDIAFEGAAMAGIMKLATAAETARDAASIAKAAKLTKGEVAAIKKLHKAASTTKPVAPRPIGVANPNDAASAAAKFVKLIKEAKPARNKKALLVHQNRQKQAGKLARVQENVSGKRLVRSTKKALQGQAASPDFAPINTNFSPQEIDTLFDMVNASGLPQGFDKGRGVIALDKLLNGQLITKSEIATLETVFGRELSRALFRKQSIGSIIQDLSFEVINLPRAVLASFDLSAPGRQGIIFSVSHPIASTKAFGRSVRAAGSLKYADDIERTTRATKFGKMADSFGVHSSPTGFTAKLSGKEEQYMSRIAERIPGVAQSERAFTTFLNQQRREVFANQAQRWIRQGITPENSTKTYQQYAKFINHATGRGSLEQLQPGALTALNAAFFSPRLQVSRAQVIGDLIDPRTTREARKVIARDLAEFYATGLGVMGMAKAGGAEVEMDPRSSDFGKIKVGNTRYNYWGPFQPLASLAGRMYTGQVKSTATGKIKDKARSEALINFLRGKLAPVPGGGLDALLGQDILGRPVEPTKKFAQQKAFESLVPLFIQDSIDAWKFQDKDGQFPVSAGLAFTGIGVQTWELAPFAELQLAKDSLSRQTFGKNADELNFIEANVLDADIEVNHPGIKALEQEVRFDSNNVALVKKQAKELRKSELLLEKRIDKNLLEAFNESKLRVGGVDRVFGSWRLNDEQYKEYQKRVADNINKLFKELESVWNAKGDDADFRYNAMTQILSSAKQQAAIEMKIGEQE